MEKILKGIMRYRHRERKQMVKQFEQVKDNPIPKALLFTCMDSRMIPTRFTTTDVGDMFVVRNAGNVVPHSSYFTRQYTCNEPAALELACVVNTVKHIVVCGHSDCKAMNLLSTLSEYDEHLKYKRTSPLKSWLCFHAKSSLEKFQQLEVSGFDKPLLFQSETPLRKFVAYIDPENKFCVQDKLSQVNCLQQLANVSSYSFLKRKLEKGLVHIHALWFDIYTGNIYYFSRQKKCFIEINEETIGELTREVIRYHS